MRAFEYFHSLPDRVGRRVRVILIIDAKATEPAEGAARCERTKGWQLVTLAQLQRRYRGHGICVLAEFPTEIAGPAALKKFTSELWRIAE